MYQRELIFGAESHAVIKQGIEKLYRAVGDTLGPRGKIFLHQPVHGDPHPTKDGVTVSKNIFLSDNAQQLGVDIVKQAAIKTCEQAGDGTTTSIVLAYNLIKNAFDLMYPDENNIKVDSHIIKKIYQKKCEEIVGLINRDTTMIDLDSDALLQVARVATNHDEDLAQSIIDTFRKAGKNASISLGYSSTGKNVAEVSSGFTLDSGYVSPFFVNDIRKARCVLENPYILLIPMKLETIREMTTLMQSVIDKKRPLVIICNEIDGDALAQFSKNCTEGKLRGCAIRMPFAEDDLRLELMRDVAMHTGATVATQELGKRMSDIGIKYLGEAEKIIIDNDSTLIIGGKRQEEKIAARIDEIKEILEKDISATQKSHYEKTLSLMHGSIGLLKVGGATESEAFERYYRAEDAICAVQSALKEGVSWGGGLSFAVLGLHSIYQTVADMNKVYATMADQEAEKEKANSDEIVIDGDDTKKEMSEFEASLAIAEGHATIAFCNALKSPFEKILTNSDFTQEKCVEILQKIYSSMPDTKFGYQLSGDGDLILSEKATIVDPTKVLRCALENAVSVANVIMNTSTISYSKIEPDEYYRMASQAANAFHKRYMGG